MPQIKIQQTQWGRQLIYTLLHEHIDENHLNEMTSDPASRLLCPFVRRADGCIQLVFQLTGLCSLCEIRQTHTLSLLQWLTMLNTVSETLAILAESDRLAQTFLDPSFIFFSAVISGEPDTGRPMLLGKPTKTDSSPAQKTSIDPHQHTAGFLAALAEPAIDLAQCSPLLTPQQADRLLVSVWESLSSFQSALSDCLYSLRSNLSQTSADPPVRQPKASEPGRSPAEPAPAMRSGTAASAPPDTRARQQFVPPDPAQSPGGVKHRVRRMLLFQAAALILSGTVISRASWPVFQIRLIGGAVLTVFLLLDLVLLLHPRSPLRTPETRRKQQSRTREHRAAAEAHQKSAMAAAMDQAADVQKKAGLAAAPLAELCPLELTHLGNDGDSIRCRQVFSAVTIADAVLTIGANPLSSDLCLPTDDIGDRHAEIRMQNGGHCLIDCGWTKNKPGSEHRTWLNGLLLTGCEPAELKDGDIIRFGRYIYQYRLIRNPSIRTSEK